VAFEGAGFFADAGGGADSLPRDLDPSLFAGAAGRAGARRSLSKAKLRVGSRRALYSIAPPTA
jgi:hypothetical protein